LFAFLGLSYFVAERLAKKFNASAGLGVDIVAKAALVIGVIGIFAAWALGTRQPADSLRSPVLLLPGILCLAILFLPRLKHWQAPAAALLILYCLTAASLYRHSYAQRWLDADWRAVRLWAQTNTRPSDRFLTPPDQIGFRVLALRSTASEALPRVIWAAPLTYVENKQAVERAAKGYASGTSDPAYLFELAREWRCDYVVARGSYDAKFAPLFRAGQFSVLKVPQLN
jgi:Ca2+/Na+ antiporter